MIATGSCHCASIRFEAEIDPELVSICSCTDCQVFSSSAFRVSVGVPSDNFRLISGMYKVYVKSAESGTRRRQAFCGDCGTPIFSSADADPPPVYTLRIGTLSERALLVPKRRVWCRSAFGWLSDIESIPGFPAG